MSRVWSFRIAALACFAIAAVGLVELVGHGSCGCSDPNAVCAAPPCPSGDVLWFVLLFAGSFIGIPLLVFGSMARWRAAMHSTPAGPVVTPPGDFSNTTSPASMPFAGAFGGAAGALPAAPAAEAERIRQLEQLDSLHRSGALSDTEFDEQKRNVLSG